ncbi:hypothetical protein SAMN05216436_12744 [bacterium A37T11]|nr:hypothetical protein SAMN05216436_12744 [bacterium A37T11]
MKKYLVLANFVFFMTQLLSAQSKDAIAGKWENPTKEGRLEIYERDNKFYGKLYWLKNMNDKNGNPKLDEGNPDPTLRNRHILGLEILRKFSYAGENVWDDGEIYDPKSGKIYKCKMTLKDSNTLQIRGYIGFSFLGRTEIWKRVNDAL